MAVVRLTDAVIPEIYNSYSALNTPELTAFLQSGILAQNDLMNSIVAQPGIDQIVPFWRDLDSSIEPDYTNDDPADLSVPNKLGSGSFRMRKSFLHQSYAAMDLVAELAGSSPMQRIKDRFGVYWSRQLQKRLIATLVGVVANNVANQAGDMGVDASTAQINGDVIIDAFGTMGDAEKNFKAFICHSAVAQRLLKNQELITIPDANGGQDISYFKGMRVIEDDSCPVLSGTGSTRVFLSFLAGSASIGFGGMGGQPVLYGDGQPTNPSYVIRVEQAGNGGGEEIIGERKTWGMNPFGYSWVEPTGADTLTEFSPTLADLRKAVVWSRVVDRKQIPLAWVKSLA